MKVLVVEDSLVTRSLIQRRVSALNHSVTDVNNGEAAWHRIIEDPTIQLLVLDLNLPDIDGTELCRRIRSEIDDRYIYVIVVTARDSMEEQTEALDAGADDVITKPFDPPDLEARIRVAERVIGWERALRRSNDELSRLVATDELTGALMTSAFLDRLDREANRCKREAQPLSIAAVDIDRITGLNLEHGHAGGDEILRAVADRIRASCRIYDLIGRFSGDEFTIALPGAGETEVALVAERIRSYVERTPVQVNDKMASVTISIGTATWTESSPGGPMTLVKSAGEALLLAKKQGRNRVIAFNPAHSGSD